MNPILYIVIVAICGLTTYGILARINYRNQLHSFRETVGVGDAVRIRLIDGTTVPARIVRRTSIKLLSVREIDSKTIRATSIENIFMP